MRPEVSQSSAGVRTGQSISCPPMRVDLLADDLDDLLVHAPASREERPQPRADLADVAAAHKQLVASRLRVGGRLAQGRKEKL